MGPPGIGKTLLARAVAGKNPLLLFVNNAVVLFHLVVQFCKLKSSSCCVAVCG